MRRSCSTGRSRTSTELADNLRDLRRSNRLLGGARQSRLAIERLVARDEPLTLIDVGTGGADIPMMLLADAARSGRPMRVTAIDERSEVIEAARIAWPAIDLVAGLDLVVGDGRSLPYADGAFDIAHASLVVHHLDPVDAVALLREMARLSRRGIVVNDLVRGRLYLAVAWLLSHLVDPESTLPKRRAAVGPQGVQPPGAARSVRRGGTEDRRRGWRLRGHRVAIAAVPA